MKAAATPIRHQSQFDEAIADYNHALQVKPDYSLAYYYLGLTARS